MKGVLHTVSIIRSTSLNTVSIKENNFAFIRSTSLKLSLKLITFMIRGKPILFLVHKLLALKV